MVIDMNYWSKVARKLIILIITISGLYFAFKLAIFYIPFLVAFILSLLIEPCIKWLMKKFKLNRRTSAIIVFVSVLLLISGLITWGIVTLIQEASNLLNGLNDYFEKAYAIINNITSYFETSQIHLPNEVQHILQNSSNEFLSRIIHMDKTISYKIFKYNYFTSNNWILHCNMCFVFIFYMYR